MNEIQWKKPVAFIVNGRVHSYITDPGDDKIMMRVAMRRYFGLPGRPWVPEYVDLCFTRKCKWLGTALVYESSVQEIYYEVENPHIRFDDADKLSAVPVITA